MVSGVKDKWAEEMKGESSLGKQILADYFHYLRSFDGYQLSPANYICGLTRILELGNVYVCILNSAPCSYK